MSVTGKQSRVRLGHLDASRGIAFLLVLAVHAMLTAGTIVKPWQTAYFMSGQRGVELFYVISAFTLFFSLDLDRAERHPLLNFYLRRFFRIAPLFYVAIAANLWINGPGLLTPMQILSGFAFCNGFVPAAINTVAVGGWSVAVETSFYAILPLLHRWLNSVGRSLAALVIVAPCMWLLSRHLAHGQPGPLLEYFSFLWFPVQMPVFFMGVLAYQIWKLWLQSGASSLTAVQRRACSGVLLLTAAVLFAANISPQPDVAGEIPWRNQHLYFASFSFVPFILALSIAPVRIFDNAVIRFFGKISYSLYLSHFFVLQWIQFYLLHHRQNGAVPGLSYGLRAVAQVYLAALVLATALSVVLFYLVEQPGMRLGRWLIAHWERPQPAPPADSLADLARPVSSAEVQF